MKTQMKTINRWLLIAGIAGGTLVSALVATAGAAPNATISETNSATGQTRTKMSSATATVTAVDHKDRMVTMKKEDGEEITIAVPKEVKMFEKLKEGDKIDIDYYESWAVSMAPTDAKPTATERRGKAYDEGGGIKGREVMISAEVVSVDPATNVVTFKGPHGNLKTIHVQDTALQQKLPSLKPGQVVQFGYVQATAAAIRPSK